MIKTDIDWLKAKQIDLIESAFDEIIRKIQDWKNEILVEFSKKYEKEK